MNRLTVRLYDNVVSLKNIDEFNLDNNITKAIQKLAAYEDTGLEPEEINHIREVTEKVEPITQNKIIELPCFVGDIVYYVEYPKKAASWNKEKPKIVQMKVIKVTYEAQLELEKIRIDTSYINKLGDYSYDWFIWDDGFLYTNMEGAEKALEASNGE